MVKKSVYSLRNKFNHVLIEEGSIGTAWGNKRKTYRVWVK